MTKLVVPEDLIRVVPNKYEAVVIISLEARRLLREKREKKIELEDKPINISIKNFLEGKVKWVMKKES